MDRTSNGRVVRNVKVAEGSARTAHAAAAVLAILFFGLALSASRHASLTWDEPSFLSAGYAYLTLGEFRFNPSHPPLAQDLIAFPLLFLDLKVPEGGWEQWARTENAVVAFGHELVFRSGNDPYEIAFWARLPVLLVGTGLVAGVYVVGSRHFGPGAALIGTAVAAFSPDLLAHSGLATEDVICAATMFAAVATFDRALHRRRRRDWILCGVATGLALLAKYTSLLLAPIYIVLFVWARCRGGWAAAAKEGAAAFATVALIALAVVGAGYNFTFDLATYWRGFRSLYGDLVPTYQHYLLGRISETPWPHYHLVAFLLKTPLPALALIGWALVRVAADPRRRAAAVTLLVPAVAIFAASFFDRANFGVRRVLPAFPFLFALTSIVVAGNVGRLARGLSAVLVAWCAIEAARIYPHPLSYFHEAVGGPQRGPYLLDDSNVDWGQDLPALAQWQSAHSGAQPLRLAYFGTADPAAYGVHAAAMEGEEIARPRPGWYAISAHHLVHFRKLHLVTGQDVDWLVKYRPVDRAGWSIWIYRFE